MLTPKCRAVLLMHRRDRFTYEEIAARMGISVSMVKKYLVRGLSVCQQSVCRDEFKNSKSLQPEVRQDG